MLHCVESIIGVCQRAKARRVDVHEGTWCPYHSLLFTNLSSLRMHVQSIRLVCLAALCQNVASIFFQVNGNSRCSLFVCCTCFVKLLCLTRYTVVCSLWIVSCTCVSARLCFVLEDDLLNSSFTFLSSNVKPVFSLHMKIIYIDRNFRVSNWMLWIGLIRPCAMSSRGSHRCRSLLS